LFVKLTRRNAPFIVASTCQSEIKRTLRRAGVRPKSVPRRGFAEVAAAHSTQMVNGWFPEPGIYGFERVDAAVASVDHGLSLINRKFTPNQIIRNFREFSPL
jgi:hypothetical protein